MYKRKFIQALFTAVLLINIVANRVLAYTTLRNQGAIAAGSSLLTHSEIADAQSVFGSSIEFSRVRIVNSRWVSVPTTLGNTIHIPPDYILPRHILIHEMTHIWQYQIQGVPYISDSVFHQVAGIMTSGDRNAAYRYTIEGGKSIYDYTSEQQASIVEHYFAHLHLQQVPEFRRLLGQVRAARPMAAAQASFQESAATLPFGFL